MFFSHHITPRQPEQRPGRGRAGSEPGLAGGLHVCTILLARERGLFLNVIRRRSKKRHSVAMPTATQFCASAALISTSVIVRRFLEEREDQAGLRLDATRSGDPAERLPPRSAAWRNDRPSPMAASTRVVRPNCRPPAPADGSNQKRCDSGIPYESLSSETARDARSTSAAWWTRRIRSSPASMPGF